MAKKHGKNVTWRQHFVPQSYLKRFAYKSFQKSKKKRLIAFGYMTKIRLVIIRLQQVLKTSDMVNIFTIFQNVKILAISLKIQLS